jgi:hypothetical protein
MDGKWWILTLLLLIGFESFGQYQYTYTDPCTGIPNTVTISQPTGAVTLFYAGQYQVFTQTQLQTGGYEDWVNSINAASPPGSNPCAGAGTGVSNGTSGTTGTVVAGSVTNSFSSFSGGTVNTGGAGSNNGGAVGAAGSAAGDKDIDSESGGQSDSESEGGASGGKSGKRVRKNSLIASGDMALVRNGNDYTAKGGDNLRLSMGVTWANTKQTITAGSMVNYTTGKNEITATAYGSWKGDEFMLVGSNTYLYSFSEGTSFNTGNIMYAYEQTSYATILLGTNYSFGVIGKEEFSNLAINAALFTTFNGYKGISINAMGLVMYSPYTYFFEGQWLSNGIIFVPLTSIDIKVSDTFKWNISTSSVMLLGEDILSFQLITGAKMLL